MIYFGYYVCILIFAVDPSKQNPFAPKPIYPSPSSLNSSVSSTNSSMTASPPTASPRTSLKIELSAPQPDKTEMGTSSSTRNDMNNNDSAGGENDKRSDIPVRKIAGKKISALFEV